MGLSISKRSVCVGTRGDAARGGREGGMDICASSSGTQPCNFQSRAAQWYLAQVAL